MSRDGQIDDLQCCVLEVERASQSVVDACRALDGDAIRASMERRGRALERLIRSIRSGTARGRAIPREALSARIASSADDVHGALIEVRSQAETQLSRLASGMKASRGYHTSPAARRSALDRSG